MKVKSNEDFLKGVYEKAETLANEKKYEKKNTNKKDNYNRFLKYSSLAAMFIIIPILLLQNNIFKENEPVPMGQPRTASFGSIDYSLSEAEYIVKGRIKSINNIESQAEITLLVEENLYGDLVADEIKILTNIEDLKPVEDSKELIVFLNKGEDSFILFNDSEGILLKDSSNTYIDLFGNNYSMEEIKELIERRK